MRGSAPLLCILPFIAAGACAPARPGAPNWRNLEHEPGHPFHAVALRVFPLTRLDYDENGDPVLIAHVEFLDAWGDSVKAAGLLQLQVFGRGVEPLVWELDLTDLEENLRRYDRATRTYRVQLADLPVAAVERLAAGAGGISVRAALVLPRGGVLEDEHELGP